MSGLVDLQLVGFLEAGIGPSRHEPQYLATDGDSLDNLDSFDDFGGED
jgi:hypothetical protein